MLPSLVVALTWLGNHIWQSETEPEIPLKTLFSLIKPSSISGEAQAIHKTVLNITARPLEEQLKDVRTRHQARQNIDKISDIKPILDTLDQYLSFRRVGSCLRSELEYGPLQQQVGSRAVSAELSSPSPCGVPARKFLYNRSPTPTASCSLESVSLARRASWVL